MTFPRLFSVLLVFSPLGCTTTLDSFDEIEDSTDGGQNTGSGDNPNSGGDDFVIEFSGPLQCESLVWCNSHTMTDEFLELPSSGGTIGDGVYRAVQGSSTLSALVIHDERYSYIYSDLLATNGTYELDGDRITLNMEFACSPNSEPGGNPVSYSIPTFYTYAVSGDDLYLRSDCGGPHCDGGATRFTKVTSLCSVSASGGDECNDGNCSCREFVESGVPDPAEGADKCAI